MSTIYVRTEQDEKRGYTLLRNWSDPGAVDDAIFAVRSIGRSLETPDDDPSHVQGLAGALAIIGTLLEHALGSVPVDVQKTVDAALEAIEKPRS